MMVGGDQDDPQIDEYIDNELPQQIFDDDDEPEDVSDCSDSDQQLDEHLQEVRHPNSSLEYQRKSPVTNQSVLVHQQPQKYYQQYL
jgi:hypothetical protein